MRLVVEQSTEDLSDEEQSLLSDAYENEASARIKKLEGMSGTSDTPPKEDTCIEDCIKELTEICNEILVSTCTYKNCTVDWVTAISRW